MTVKCINVDEGGKVRLSRKQALEEIDQSSQSAPL
jgi:predicted RNA-binding protein with RPS1 domain